MVDNDFVKGDIFKVFSEVKRNPPLPLLVGSPLHSILVLLYPLPPSLVSSSTCLSKSSLPRTLCLPVSLHRTRLSACFYSLNLAADSEFGSLRGFSCYHEHQSQRLRERERERMGAGGNNNTSFILFRLVFILSKPHV
eukprot:764978-Hanusia_phi.AAC.3